MGRVGLPAPMPARIRTTVDAYYYGADLRKKTLEVDALSAGCACFVGRDGKGNRVVSLVLTEKACENAIKALDKLTEEEVHDNGRASLKAIITSSEIQKKLEDGIQLSSPQDGNTTSIKIETKGGQIPVLHLMWNGEGPREEVQANDKLVKGIVFHIQTHPEQPEN